MRRWRFLLRPGWLALTAVVICFTILAFTVLAPWQFHRGAERSERNAAIEQSYTVPPQPLREVLPRGQAPGRGSEWRQVRVSGQYLPEAETVARLRTVQGEPAFEVLVPLRLADGSTLLVNRGFLRPAEGAVPPYPPVPTGEVTVTGRLRADEPEPRSRESVVQDGHLQVYAVNSRLVGQVTGVELEPGYLQLVEGAPGVLAPLPLPHLSAGPHFAYALQWWAFGAMVPLALIYFAWREGRGWDRGPDDQPHDQPHDDPRGGRFDDPRDLPPTRSHLTPSRTDLAARYGPSR